MDLKEYKARLKEGVPLSKGQKLFIRRAKAALVLTIMTVLFVYQNTKAFIEAHAVEFSILLFLGLSYFSYTSLNEHFVLTVAMFMCLYAAYDLVCSMIKAEVRTRNDQIFRESLKTNEDQIFFLEKKKELLRELESISVKMDQIRNSSHFNPKPRPENFLPVSVLEENIKTVLLEEMSLLDLVHKHKNQQLEVLSQGLDLESEFIDSKSEELHGSAAI